MERGQENCYLLTNGLGGFSSASMIGSNTRNDHALLMACIHAPNRRYNMIHRLEEQIFWGEGQWEEGALSVPGQGYSFLSSQDYTEKGCREEGYLYLSAFRFEDYPVWTYDVNGVEIVKRIAMKQGENLVAVKYTVDNQSGKEILLKVTPHLQFVPKGMAVERYQVFTLEEGTGVNGSKFPLEEGTGANDIQFSVEEGAGVSSSQFPQNKGVIRSQGLTVFYQTNGVVQRFSQNFTEGLYYAYDACDGRMCEGNTHTNHCILKKIPKHACQELEIVFSMEDICVSADQVLREAAAYRGELVRVSGMKQEAAEMLVKSAAQFVVKRVSTGGKTILAGYPFFEDWGRDTMIALAGCCITTRQFETAKSILRTFASYCRDGLMPNLFPEGKDEPQYNTADAALLYIQAVYLYVQKSDDMDFLEEIWPVMEEIIRCYKNGTSYGIRMDTDGLLFAGQDLDQVTWMDVRIGEILPTPRHGKPVEINAYWYNALCIMDVFAKRLQRGGADDYARLAEKTKQSFRAKFWSEKNQCLKDVLSGTEADEQIRCNQIWAVSMPFTMLEEAQERQVVDTVYEKLYTPYGLRTLDMQDSQFSASYGGSQMERDLAYHQGTVWVFPLGAYYLAYVKTRKYAEDAVRKVKRQLEVLESAMGEGCIGQLPEIYDGKNPAFSRGCFAQAWSVGEILRVYEMLETCGE